MTESRFSDAFTFLPQGAIIQEFKVAGHNIVLGFPTAAPYQTHNTPFFGETIGRVANRIADAQINLLNGKPYPLHANNGPNTLHGGQEGWGKRTFEGPTPVNRHGKESVSFRYVSKHGEEGFPGTVELRLWYISSIDHHEGVDKTTLEIEYEVELIGDEVEETVVALTNHSYFNISDASTIQGTKAILHTNLHQVVDSHSIPTGDIQPYPGITANQEFTLEAEQPDIDHCFIVNPHPDTVPLDTRHDVLRPLVTLTHPDTHLHLEALSTEPAFQFYTGRYIDVPAIDGAPARGPRSGLCIEASRYINAVNDPRWKSMVVLKKGQIWGSRTVYRAWKA